MKLVVLDGYTLNPGDLSWEDLRQQGSLVVYDRTALEDIEERCRGAAAVFTNKTPLPSAALEKLSDLKYIGVLATGYNIVDVTAAKKQGILVANAPGYSTDSVVQMTFALLLELAQHVQRHSDSVRDGKWSRSADFCYWDFPLMELSGKTMGIIGMGHIGSRVAKLANAFGMDVIGTSRTRKDPPLQSHFRWAEIPELLDQSDVVSIHCPLLPETRGLIHKKSLSLMKRTAFLLNTSRGPIIVEEDLAMALNNEVIAGAGIDVLSIEPPAANNPLFSAKNCVITPHISWATREARSRLMKITADNFAAFVSGTPIHVVNP